jgi:PAS domain S-box-containing protein
MTRPDYKTDQTWFKQLFESSPDPAWIIDGNRFVECNDAAIRTLGYASRDEFLNVHPSRLSPPKQPDGQDSYAKAEQMMALALERGLHRFCRRSYAFDGGAGGPAGHLLRLARHHGAQEH